MSRIVTLFILWALMLINITHADELLDRCTSTNAHTESEVETLWGQAVKESRVDCLGALLSNADFNNRGIAQRLIAKLAPDKASFVLKTALQTDEIWIEPKKLGEDIAAFSVLKGRYLELFHANGIQATGDQLLSKDGRTALLRLLSSRLNTGEAATGRLLKSDTSSQETPSNSSSLPPKLPAVQPPAQKNAPETSPTPPTTSKEATSSTPWSVIVILIVAAFGLLWLLLKRRS